MSEELYRQLLIEEAIHMRLYKSGSERQRIEARRVIEHMLEVSQLLREANKRRATARGNR